MLKRKFFQISAIIFVVSMVFVVFLHYNMEQRYRTLFDDSNIEVSLDLLFSDMRLCNAPIVYSLDVGDTAWISNIIVLKAGIFIDLNTPTYAYKTNEHSFMIIKTVMGYIIDSRYYDGSDIVIIAKNSYCRPKWTKVHNFIWTM